MIQTDLLPAFGADVAEAREHLAGMKVPPVAAQAVLDMATTKAISETTRDGDGRCIAGSLQAGLCLLSSSLGHGGFLSSLWPTARRTSLMFWCADR